jgi:hypothetical protein
VSPCRAASAPRLHTAVSVWVAGPLDAPEVCCCYVAQMRERLRTCRSVRACMGGRQRRRCVWGSGPDGGAVA